MMQTAKSASVPPQVNPVTAATTNTSSSTLSDGSVRKSFFSNFVAGGISGIVGVVATCPLDVVQTRLQSSIVSLSTTKVAGSKLAGVTTAATATAAAATNASNLRSKTFGLNVYYYMKHIVQTEGVAALYKGLVPNLIGIAPSRAIYFSVYSKTKGFVSSTWLANSPWTHMISALSASWCTSTMTNPIWFVKTRLQLDMTATGARRPLLEVVHEVFRNEGIRGFYRGLSASYMGASETMVYFVLYEKFKSLLHDSKDPESKKLTPMDYVYASFVAKLIATVSVYPHEVVRTRLRQESSKLAGDKKYKGFFQTLLKVYKEERIAGIYGGMGAHLMRQVPNTVIMFLTYEMIVNVFSND